MRKLMCLFLMTIPIAAIAQKDLFMSQFNGVNNWFFSSPDIKLIQKYVYYNDSATVHAVDSATITIIKNNSAIHYEASGLELFSDSGYMVKMSHSNRYMLISKIAKIDTLQLAAIFSQVFSGFATFKQISAARGNTEWELYGGTAGINSAKLVLDLEAHQVKSLEMFMAGNHPLVRPFKKAGQTAEPTVIIKVDYQYLPGTGHYKAGTLRDFIIVNTAGITPAAKYKDYRIKLIPGKQ